MAVQPMDNRIGMINYLDYRYSLDKGEAKEGQVFNSALNKLASDPYYTSDLVVNEAHTLGTALEFTVDWAGLKTVEKVLDANGAELAYTVAGDTITVTGAAAGDAITVTYRFDNETVASDSTDNGWGTKVPEVELKMNSIPVEARARTLRSYWAFDAQYELQKELTKLYNIL